MTGTGLLLFTGGAGRRLGGPKHDRPHPAGGTWGGHLVGLFEALRPGAPLQVLGASLPDRPDLPVIDDPRQGPAVALRAWAARSVPAVRAWLLLPCDQVGWTAESLQGWLARAEAADPPGKAWVLPSVAGRDQYLGSLLGAALRPALATLEARSLAGLAERLPVVRLPEEGPGWQDVDAPEDLQEKGLAGDLERS